MDISASQSNIGAAFEVVRQTYHNLALFFKELDEVADRQGYTSLVQSSPGFLRWKSDANAAGWMVDSFIKLYQKSAIGDVLSTTTALKAQFFGVEVNFEKKDGPVVHIIRYEYPDNAGNETSIPVSMHWQFFWPLRSKTDFEIEEAKPERSVSTSVPKSMAVATKYRGLTKASWKTRDLVGITQEGMADLVREFEGAW